MHAQPERRRAGLTDSQLEEGFAHLTAYEWRFKEARAFTRRVKAAPGVAAPFLVERLLSGSRRERDLASALLAEIEGPRVIAPMWDLLQDPSLPREARAAAGAVLESMGEEPARRVHPRDLHQPEAFLSDAWEAVFSRAQNDELFVEQFIAALEQDEEISAQDVILSLAEPRDERALKLLTPLLSMNRINTVLTAIEALELLASEKSVPLLEEAAAGHPSPRARKQARTTWGRLVMQAPLFPPERPLLALAPEPRGLPLRFAGVSLLDQQGDQAVLIARQRDGDYLKVVTVLVSDTLGVKSCVGVDQMRPEELEAIKEQLETQGLPVVSSGLTFCLDLIEQARATSVRKQRRLPVELEVWKDVIDGPAGEPTITQLGLWDTSGESDSGVLGKTSALLATPEFRQWHLDADLVWPFIDEWQSGSPEQQEGATLDALVELAARDLIDCDFRELLGRRLARQSELLLRTGKDELAYLSSVASRTLDPESAVAAQHHPFVRALIMSSFFNAGLRLPQAYASAVAADGGDGHG